MLYNTFNKNIYIISDYENKNKNKFSIDKTKTIDNNELKEQKNIIFNRNIYKNKTY